MTSIHVVDQHNSDRYADILTAYHRKRHDIFVGERGWTGLYKPNGLEIDQYDNEHAIYLLALDGEKLVGGQRLYPTMRPHMLSDCFAHLVECDLPRNVRTLEWTRYFVVRERRTGRTDCRLLAAVQQYCLEEGVEHLTAVVEMWWLLRWQQSGFKVQPLGLPQMVEGQATLAVRIEVSEESLASVMRIGGLKSTPLTYLPAYELADAA